MNNNRSFEALLKFLDYLKNKGLMKPATVKARKASANKVLSIMEPSELEDVTTIDLDDAMRRFSNLEGQNYTPISLSVYKSRTKSVIEDFEAYLENPLGFRPSVNNRSTTKKKPPVTPSTVNENLEPNVTINQPQKNFSHEDNILPIQIRQDKIIRIQGLPFDSVSYTHLTLPTKA